MSLEDYTTKVRGMVGEDSGLGKTLKFDLGDDGVITIDGKSTPNTVSNENGEADCTVKLSSDNFGKLLEGKGNPMTMFMTGKIKVTGDMGVAMKLQSLFKK